MLLLEGLSAVLGNGDRHEVPLSIDGEGLHLEALKELHLIHKASEWVSPAISNSLKELSLHGVELKPRHGSSSSDFSSINLDERVGDWSLTSFSDDALLDHVVDH